MTIVKGPAFQYLETSSSSFHSIHLYNTVIQHLLLSRFVSKCFRQNLENTPLTGPNLEQDHAHCLLCFSLLFPEILLKEPDVNAPSVPGHRENMVEECF